jgi:hypothetical protein
MFTAMELYLFLENQSLEVDSHSRVQDSYFEA